MTTPLQITIHREDHDPMAITAHMHIDAAPDGGPPVHICREHAGVTAGTTVAELYNALEALATALSWPVTGAWVELPVPQKGA